MNTKHIILMACAALLGAAQANAQGQDLSILTVNTDAKTAAIGNANHRCIFRQSFLISYIIIVFVSCL